ncbi:MAG: polysaccharide biosynthesis/export family protein [Myxococcota bacterium]
MLTLLSAMACGTSTAPAARVGGAAKPPIENAVLGPGDVFEVRVFGEEGLSGAYRVASDGTIDFPLVGKTKVDGLTASTLSDLLRASLSRYVNNPSVSVFLKEYNSRKIFVFGQVREPGTFPYEQGMNIVQAITSAGGFDKLADQDGTSVTRVVDGHEQRLKISVKAIAEGRAQNFTLEPGDIVFVPETIF